MTEAADEIHHCLLELLDRRRSAVGVIRQVFGLSMRGEGIGRAGASMIMEMARALISGDLECALPRSSRR